MVLFIKILMVLEIILFLAVLILMIYIGYLYPKALRIENPNKYAFYYPTKFNHYLLPFKYDNIIFKNEQAKNIIIKRNNLLPYVKITWFILIINSIILFYTTIK